MSSPDPERRARCAILVLAVLVGALLLFPAPVEAASGRCHSAKIEEPFRLPDGSLHPPGRLTLCERGAWSPVSTFHEVKVDGERVTMLASRHQTNEAGPTEPPFLMFVRTRDGSLTLLGYAYPSRGGMQSHAFGPAADRVAVLARPTDETETLLFVAARTGPGDESVRN